MPRRATGYDNRGKNDNRPSRKAFREPKHQESTSSLVVEAGLTWDCAFTNERDRVNQLDPTGELGIQPRKSLTEQQHLALFDAPVEKEDRKVSLLTDDAKKVIATDQLIVGSVTKPGMYGKPQEIAVTTQAGIDRLKERGRFYTVTNPAVVWRGPRTLLRRGIPDEMRTDIKRETSRSKRRVIQPGEGRPVCIEVPIHEMIDEPGLTDDNEQ